MYCEVLKTHWSASLRDGQFGCGPTAGPAGVDSVVVIPKSSKVSLTTCQEECLKPPVQIMTEKQRTARVSHDPGNRGRSFPDMGL